MAARMTLEAAKVFYGNVGDANLIDLYVITVNRIIDLAVREEQQGLLYWRDIEEQQACLCQQADIFDVLITRGINPASLV